MLPGWDPDFLLQSSNESGSGALLVSGSNRHKPQPTMGALVYTTMAAKEIAPSGLEGRKVVAREPTR